MIWRDGINSDHTEIMSINNGQNQERGIGLVVVTHGSFGEGLLEAAQLILGPQEGCATVSIGATHGVDGAVESIKKAVTDTDAGSGTMILTDLFGGTPTTLSLSLFKSDHLEVIAGVNLPMVIKALQGRTLPLHKLAGDVKAAGQQGIVVAGEMLRRRKSEG